MIRWSDEIIFRKTEGYIKDKNLFDMYLLRYEIDITYPNFHSCVTVNIYERFGYNSIRKLFISYDYKMDTTNYEKEVKKCFDDAKQKVLVKERKEKIKKFLKAL